MSIAEHALKKCLSEVHEDLIPIIKSLANEIRFRILMTLLTDDVPFRKLCRLVGLKKTALSNHLTQLLEVNLIQKASYGVYSITQDGIDYLRSIYQTWQQSLRVSKQKLQTLESRSMSTAFLNKFLGK